ncbi:MAG TPA: mercuric reductase [Usitatibacter sp.]|nr:mercuric reductase [Usitatibacter sp.]
MDPDFDVFVIGAGQAGSPLAKSLAEKGRRVALAERSDIGGSCVNFGCTPTKAAFASTRIAHLARRGAQYGLRIPTIDVDYAAVVGRARDMAVDFRNHLAAELAKVGNLTMLAEHVRLEGRDGDLFRLRAGSRSISARRVVLDTGTRSVIPPIEGLDQAGCVHAGNWLDLADLPARLVVIGGGYIGLEMAQFYRRLGSEVTVLEGGGRVAGHEDEDVAAALQKLLEAEGIRFRLHTRVEKVEGKRGALTITAGDARLEATHMFVATGRRPNTDDLGLETVGVKTSKHGIVEVDEKLATSVAGIWAAGDIRGGPMFTHTAWDDYRILESQIAGDGSRTTERIVPYAVFTDPELGRVGMTESEARKAGHRVKIGRFAMKANGKAIEVGETAGFIKVVIDADDDRLLGAAVLATEGAELVHVYVALMNARAPFAAIRDAVFIHPTLAEAVQSAVSEIG